MIKNLHLIYLTEFNGQVWEYQFNNITYRYITKPPNIHQDDGHSQTLQAYTGICYPNNPHWIERYTMRHRPLDLAHPEQDLIEFLHAV